MTVFNRKDTHVETALANRAPPFQITDVGLLMQPIAEEIAEVEAAAWDLFDQRFIDNAVGVWLTQLGAVVGEPDLGDGATAFKLRIALKLRAILSKLGKRSDFLELLGILSDTSWALREQPGWAVFVQTDATLVDSKALARLLHIASADGVMIDLTTNETAAAAFTWPSEDGTITGGDWASEDGTTTGDPWQGVRIQ